VTVEVARREPGQSGLSTEEAAERLRRHGPNAVPEAPKPRIVRRVLAQLRDPMILLLCGAFVLVVAIGDLPDAAIIAAVVVVNSTIGVVQEVRAQRAVTALRAMAAPRARVVRDGRVIEVASADLVPGDLVRLDAGDVVPADLALTEAVALAVDEAAVTGESVPVARTVGQELLAGTVVTTGRCSGLALRTGADSALGRIAALVAAAPPRPTPLQRRLSRLSRQLVVVTTAICVVVLLLALGQGTPLVEALVLAVSLGVAAIPESLPAVVSVALALGAKRMARRSAVVRWLPAVETLGSVSVLATDKTGTITQGAMVVERLWAPSGPVTVTGEAYGASGVADPAAGDRDGSDLDRLLCDLVLCNDARLVGPADGEWGFLGDPMEAALLVAAAKRSRHAGPLRDEWPRTGERPFDSATASMSTTHRRADGAVLTVTKGAPERVLTALADAEIEARARSEARKLAADGYRVIAVTDSGWPAQVGPPGSWVGLVGIADPPRADAASVVAACRAAGIEVVLVTGDHAETARAIADRVGISRPGASLVTGEAVTGEALSGRIEDIDVFARTRPEQKVDIVRAWQERGRVVAMTGDGVNDAPALRVADIGVAMGARGTEVARQAADLVLADDNLATVVRAVGEGRRVYANIRTFLRYGLAGGLAEVVVLLLAPFLGLGIALLPAQILWINLLTHGVPGVAFGDEPLDPRLMRRPSPSPEQAVLSRALLRQVGIGGALIAAVTLGSALVAHHTGASAREVQTWTFLTLGFGQLGVALGLRTPRTRWSPHGRALELSVLLAGALQVLGATAAPLRDLLGTAAVSLPVLVSLLAVGALPGLVVGAGEWWGRRRDARAGPR
jgi:Ca2+-transporting ATPase